MALVALIIAAAPAAAGEEVIADYQGIEARFTQGNADDFTVIYDVRILRLPDGSTAAIFNQRGSDDLLGGPINAEGVPRFLLNPGLERMKGGRITGDRTLVYTLYRYKFPNGQVGIWRHVEMTFPPGALPFPLPADAEAQESPSPSASASPSPTPQTETSDPTPTSAEDSGGGGALTGIIVGLVAGGIGVAVATMVRRKKKGCDEEKARFEEASRRFDEAIQAESDAKFEYEKARSALDSANAARSVAEAEAFGKYASDPAGYDKGVADWAAQKPAFDAKVQEAQTNLDAATAARDEATKRREELEAEREAAKKAYEECVGQQMQEAAAASTDGGSGVATAPAPYGQTRTRGCKPGDPPRNARHEGTTSVDLVIDFEVRATPHGIRGYQDAEVLATSLKEIAEQLGELGEGKLPGAAGDLQDLGGKAKALKENLDKFKGKSIDDVGEVLDEILQEQLEEAIKAEQEKINEQLKEAANTATGLGDAWGAATKVPELLKEPYKIPIEILKMTAEFGAMVALFAGKVTSENDMYTVEARVKTLQVDILWRSQEECVNGRWTRVYNIVHANGPTEWQAWQKLGEFPGRATGRGLDDGLRRALQWCQTKMNSSSEDLSRAMNEPPKKR